VGHVSKVVGLCVACGHMLLIIDVDHHVLTKGSINVIHDSWFSCNFSYIQHSYFVPVFCGGCGGGVKYTECQHQCMMHCWRDWSETLFL
jgi:hypothetical protein